MSQKYSELIKFTRAITRRAWRLRGKYEKVSLRINRSTGDLNIPLNAPTDFRVRGTYRGGTPILFITIKEAGEKSKTVTVELDDVQMIQTLYSLENHEPFLSHEYIRGEEGQFNGTYYK